MSVLMGHGFCSRAIPRPRSRWLLVLSVVFAFGACSYTQPTDTRETTEVVTRQNSPEVHVLGDSMLSWNGMKGNSVPSLLRKRHGLEVKSEVLPGLTMQMIAGAYSNTGAQAVVFNGGGNDLLFGCGCAQCTSHLDRIIHPDLTSGYIPKLVGRINDSGSHAFYVGYLRTPGRQSPIEACAVIGDVLEARVAQLAKKLDGLTYVPVKDAIPHGSLRYHTIDRIHPSIAGSRMIAEHIAYALKHRSEVRLAAANN